MFDFLRPETVAALAATQFAYSREFVIGAGSANTANTQGSGSIAIQSGFHFFTESLWLDFPTVESVDSSDIDDGVCRLTLQLNAGTTTPMFQNPVKLSLLGVPGRMPQPGALTTLGETPAPGQSPHIPGFPWSRFLPAGTQLQHIFANTSNKISTVNVMWRGWNIPAGNCPTASDFDRILRACQSPLAVA